MFRLCNAIVVLLRLPVHNDTNRYKPVREIITMLLWMIDRWDGNSSGDDNDDEYHQYEDKTKLLSLKVEMELSSHNKEPIIHQSLQSFPPNRQQKS